MFPYIYINWWTPPPKGPHNVHLSTMCHLLWWIGQGGNFNLFIFRPQKNTNLVEDIKILLPVKFRWVPFSGFRGKVKICLSQSEARAAILFFWISPKNTNLVEDVENLLSVKFCWIPFIGFIGEVKNVSANQRTGLLSYFWSARKKNASLVEDVKILLPVKFCWILFSGFRGKVENVSANHRPGRPFCFSDPPEKHKLGRGRWDLASYQVSSDSFHSFREVENISANQRPGRPFCFFPICLKNTNVVEGIESLIPVKFRWIPFSGFRGEVENVSANQRPGRPSCFSDRPQKHKLGRGRLDLDSCQVLLNSIQLFQRRSRKYLS